MLQVSRVTPGVQRSETPLPGVTIFGRFHGQAGYIQYYVFLEISTATLPRTKRYKNITKTKRRSARRARVGTGCLPAVAPGPMPLPKPQAALG